MAHIDVMALQGINVFLAITGQEEIQYKAFESVGLTDTEIREFFNGPAYLTWYVGIVLAPATLGATLAPGYLAPLKTPWLLRWPLLQVQGPVDAVCRDRAVLQVPWRRLRPAAVVDAGAARTPEADPGANPPARHHRSAPGLPGKRAASDQEALPYGERLDDAGPGAGQRGQLCLDLRRRSAFRQYAI